MESNNGKITITYREALKQSLRQALQKDEHIFLMGKMWGITEVLLQ